MSFLSGNQRNPSPLTLGLNNSELAVAKINRETVLGCFLFGFTCCLASRLHFLINQVKSSLFASIKESMSGVISDSIKEKISATGKHEKLYKYNSHLYGWHHLTLNIA